MEKDTSIKTGSPQVSCGADVTKLKKRSFELKEKCQDLVSDVYILTSSSQKEYRTSLCKKVQDYSCEAVHSLRLANSLKIGTVARKNAQNDSLEMLGRLQDLLPVLTKCRCITPEQEKLLDKKVSSLKVSLERWLEKDMERLEEVKAKKPS
ncbi:MAG: hypothetical protein J6I68_04010 [Butyrivibrio sp.]|uniref:hypothetical protein n=1 Tax=Butyrivibrio sp. TaxID=28121 RepID=UPI001B476C2F|nr:hypothetical protein [Butyrivibrio sp.]MBP3782392.1 hypothetical protein [Butyrivibrio sp.]